MDGEIKVCPICGHALEVHGTVAMCPMCGALYPLAPVDTDSAAEIAPWHAELQAFIAAGDYAQAAALLDRLNKACPEDPEIHDAQLDLSYRRDFPMKNGILTRYTGSDARVTVPTGFRAIGPKAFEGAALTELELPEGVQEIQSGAFRGCRGLESVRLPTSLVAIGNSAFKDCAALKAIRLPANITSIGSYAFAGCLSLSALALPARLSTLGYRAFHNCSGLVSISLPRGLNDVRAQVFSGCTHLISVSWPGHTVDDSPGSPFHGTPAITGKPPVPASSRADPSVSATDGDASATGTGTSGAGGSWAERTAAFSGSARSTVRRWASTLGGTGSASEAGAGSGSTVSSARAVPEWEPKYREYLAAGNYSDAQHFIRRLLDRHISDPALRRAWSDMCIWVPYSVRNGELLRYNGSERRVAVPPGLTKIGNKAFQNSDCTHIELPEGITSIGDQAFAVSTSLTGISLPASLTAIGTGAFMYCSALTAIALPDSVTTLGGNAFQACTGLVTAILSPRLSTIGSCAFSGCRALKSLELKTGMTSISPGMFSDCQALEAVTVPNTVTHIGNGAFENCTALTSLTLPGSLERIDERAFAGCPQLSSVDWPDHSIGIGSNVSAFRGTPALMQCWRELRLCQHCGGLFKGILFKRCTVCGTRKDY